MYRWMPLLAGIVVLSCAGPPDDGSGSEAAGPGMTEEERRTVEAELIEADREFARQVRRHGIGGWLGGFAPTGRMVAGGESYIGQEGIRRAMLPVFADSTLEFSWDPTYAEVAASGDLGYTVGTYEMSSREGGSLEASTGTYLTVWRRQADGRWLVQADIGNPAPAATDAED